MKMKVCTAFLKPNFTYGDVFSTVFKLKTVKLLIERDEKLVANIRSFFTFSHHVMSINEEYVAEHMIFAFDSHNVVPGEYRDFP